MDTSSYPLFFLYELQLTETKRVGRKSGTVQIRTGAPLFFAEVLYYRIIGKVKRKTRLLENRKDGTQNPLLKLTTHQNHFFRGASRLG